MKKLNKVAMLIAAAALSTVAGAQTVDNWRSATGDVWMSGTGLCWRDASWTPATAAVGCDGAIVAPKPAPAPAPAPAPVVGPPPPPPPPPDGGTPATWPFSPPPRST